jgi:hypothetical protein
MLDSEDENFPSLQGLIVLAKLLVLKFRDSK